LFYPQKQWALVFSFKFFQIIGSLGRPPDFGLISSAHWDDDFKHAEGGNPVGWFESRLNPKHI
jgi:hypothetical protein